MNRGYPSSYPDDQEENQDSSSTSWAPPVRPTPYKPLVTYTILAITISIYILQEVSGFAFNGIDIPARLGMKVNALIIQGEYWRLLTPMLLHGSVLHIAFNMYALFIFGPGLERHFGRLRFLTLYLLSGFAGNVISFVFSPSNSLGSSTAIFGLIGAQGVFLYLNRDLFAGTARQALGQIVTIAAINLFIGLSPGIDNWGHIGGLAGGILFTWLAGPLLEVQGYPPNISVRDQRESRSIILAALAVALFFMILAVVTISGRGG
jgi:rhomboid protease GluP